MATVLFYFLVCCFALTGTWATIPNIPTLTSPTCRFGKNTVLSLIIPRVSLPSGKSRCYFWYFDFGVISSNMVLQIQVSKVSISDIALYHIPKPETSHDEYLEFPRCNTSFATILPPYFIKAKSGLTGWQQPSGRGHILLHHVSWAWPSDRGCGSLLPKRPSSWNARWANNPPPPHCDAVCYCTLLTLW